MFTTYQPAFVNDTAVIPAGFLNQVRVDHGRAIDGGGGGAYTPSAVIDVGGSGFGTIDIATLLEIQVGGQHVDPLGGIIADGDNQTLTLAQGQVRQFIASGAGRVHILSVTDATAGSWIHFIGLSTNAGNIAINPVGAGFGAGVDIVTLPLGNWSAATVYFDALGSWRLMWASALAVPGPAA